MGTGSQASRQRFPFDCDDLFSSALSALKAEGFKVRHLDRTIGRISASTGMSLFSWGENLTLTIEPDGDGGAVLGIESSLKVGVNLAGNHRHSKNFDKIVRATSRELKRMTPRS